MPDTPLARDEISALLDLVESTLSTALDGNRVALPDLDDLPPGLRARSGLFVSLHVEGELNGCIGTIESVEPLGRSAARMALSAAFDDPRLPALRPHEWAHLEIEVSILSPLSPIGATCREDLVAELRPGVDGAVVTAGSRRGLFLPAVWEQIPAPEDFVDHLWHKAGLVPRTWPRDVVTERFTAARHARTASAAVRR